MTQSIISQPKEGILNRGLPSLPHFSPSFVLNNGLMLLCRAGTLLAEGNDDLFERKLGTGDWALWDYALGG